MADCGVEADFIGAIDLVATSNDDHLPAYACLNRRGQQHCDRLDAAHHAQHVATHDLMDLWRGEASVQKFLSDEGIGRNVIQLEWNQ